MNFRIGLTSALAVLLLRASAMAEANATPQDVFDGMKLNFRSDKASDARVRYQFSFSGPHGGNWWIEVKDGEFELEQGKIPAPDVTFRASDKDWVALSNGELNGAWAFLSGRLKVEGDRELARKLGEIFP